MCISKTCSHFARFLILLSPLFNFYRIQVYLGSDLWVRVSETDPCEIYTSYASYASFASDANASYASYTSYRLYAEKVTVSSGAIWWPHLELMQVAPYGGQICN